MLTLLVSHVILLHVACNMAVSDNTLRNQALRALQAQLPQDWRLHSRPDLDVELTDPDGKKTRLLVEVKRNMEPRDVRRCVEHMDEVVGRRRNAVPVIVSPFLTARTRQLLVEARLSYLDLTGNCWLVSRSPGLFISTSGENRNPQAEDRPVRSLKGPVAGRMVRALCDFLPPLGVRELAARVGADPGYVSRLLALLDREALITRPLRGPVEDVRWKDLIRRWTADYSPFAAGRVYRFLASRGLQAFAEKLRAFDQPYALTGSMAAAVVAPVAPPRLAVCYVDDAEAAGQALDLRPAEAGINVMLVVPFDAVVYDRTWEKKNLKYVALSQVAADLLRSAGRGPEEGDALLEWMAEHQHVWRT